jgi:hypothetical protein
MKRAADAIDGDLETVQKWPREWPPKLAFPLSSDEDLNDSQSDNIFPRMKSWPVPK